MSPGPADQPPWRGFVNMMLYGTVLRERADDALVNQLADALFSPRHFTYPVEVYYRAAVAGLNSGKTLVVHDEWQTEDTVRDFLARLVDVLDARRPWPAPNYTLLDSDPWPTDSAPLIGRIHISPHNIEAQIGASFSATEDAGAGQRIIVLRLRTGQLCRLRITSFRDRDVALCSAADPAETCDAFRRLTGLEVTPA